MSIKWAPGTSVELHDTRELIGVGSSIRSVKFPVFHMFDANWKLKFLSEWDEDVSGHRISLRLRHRRREDGDLWSLNAAVGIQIDEKFLKREVLVEADFTHRRREIDIPYIGIVKNIPTESDIQIHAKIFMQINQSMGIQLRNFIDFSRPLPIFSDATVRVEGVKLHVNRMILSMASPVFLRSFIDILNDSPKLEVCAVSYADFRRLLNMIYPPHLPPKQWIKENDPNKRLEHCYRLLDIAKNLDIPIVFETADKWLAKFARFEIGDALLLAQTFGLRKLMGSTISRITSTDDIVEFRPQLHLLSSKTKALILDNLLYSL